jgi:hypothetical protein
MMTPKCQRQHVDYGLLVRVEINFGEFHVRRLSNSLLIKLEFRYRSGTTTSQETCQKRSETDICGLLTIFLLVN